MPRPRTPLDVAGTVVGAGVGAAAGGPAGALLGGLLGSMFNPGGEPIELADAVERACDERDLDLAMCRRDSLYQVTVIFQRPANSYWHVVGRARRRAGQNHAQIDDALYDDVVAKLDEWLDRNAP